MAEIKWLPSHFAHLSGQTQLRMSRPLFVGSYLQVTWWILGQWKGKKFASNNKVGYIGGGSFTIWLQKRFLWYSSRDSVRKARESHFIDKAMILEPNDLKSRRIIVIYIFISLSFRFYVIRHFRLSLLNIFLCDILHLYNVVIPIINSVTSVNLKKASMASRILFLITNARYYYELCTSLWTSSFFYLNTLAD